MDDIRDVLRLAAVTPTRLADVDEVVARAGSITVRRRVGGIVGAVLAALVIVPLGSQLQLAGDGRDVRTIERQVADGEETSTALVTGETGPPPSGGEAGPGGARPAITPRPRGGSESTTGQAGQVGGQPDGSGDSAGTPVPTTPSSPAPAATSARGDVVFVSDRDGNWDLYVLGAAGVTRRLTATAAMESSPAWSPDGSRIAFVRAGGDGTTDIFSMRADGSELRQLTSSPGNDRSPAWSPDGRRLAFISDRDGAAHSVISYSSGPTTQRVAELWVMDASGAGQRRVVSSDSDINGASWSPDGGRLAYSRDNDERVTAELWVVDLDSEERRLVFFDDRFNLDPAWSPDGTRLAYSGVRGGSSHIGIVDVGGAGTPRVVTSASGFAFHPSWSDDGVLLYSQDADGPTYHETGSGNTLSCSAIREDAGTADACPQGPLPTELWSVAADGTGGVRVVGDLANAVDGDW